MHSGEDVRRGQQIATVGTANGRYFAHLHFECASSERHSSARVIAQTRAAGLNPAAFIEPHRGAPEDDVGRVPIR